MKLFSDELYSSGGGIPEGLYALEFLACMHQATNQTTGAVLGPPRLGVMVTAHPIDEAGASLGEARQKFYGMGSNAHASFLPTEDGKDLAAVPGGRFTTLMGNTNWALLRKSLVDCDPAVAGLETLAELDGVWARLANVPEPEERKNFGPKTGEAALAQEGQPERKGPGLVGIVTEILENGKPWEGGGGLPTEAAALAAKPKPGPKGVVKPPVAKAAAPKAPVAKAAAAPVEDEDISARAVTLISAQLENNMAGMKRLKLRTEVFKAAGPDGNQVVSTVFASDESLMGFLQPLGFTINGADIVPTA